MVNSCIVTGCANRQIKGVNLSFCRLPKDAERRRLWLAAICRKNYNPSLESDVRVCGAHFISGVASTDKRSPDYVPLLNMGYDKKIHNPASCSARYERGLRREVSKIIENGRQKSEANEADSVSLNSDETSIPETSFQIMETQIEDFEDESVLEDTTHIHCLNDLERLEERVDTQRNEINNLRVEKKMLEDQLKASKMCYEFLDTNEKVLDDLPGDNFWQYMGKEKRC
eukprot:gene5057-5716_t